MLGGQGRLDCSKKEENTPEEKYKLVTFVLKKMKLSNEHRKTKKKDKEKKLDPKIIQFIVQSCGDSNMACKWINGEFAQGTKYKETTGKIQKTLHPWWKRGIAKPISNILTAS